MLGEPEKQFSLTRAAPATSGRAKKQILISYTVFLPLAKNASSAKSMG